MLEKILKLTTFSLLLSLLGFSQIAYADPLLEISAIDTVANFETVVNVRNAAPNESLLLELENPNRTLISLFGTTDTWGNAEVKVSEGDTKIAGIYRVKEKKSNAVGTFQVFPGGMDTSRSALYTSKGFVAANGIDLATVNVRITDEFGNPLEYHEVKLISSRRSDVVVTKNEETDANGIATFLVSSREAGIATFTATDETSSETLESRLRITFVKAAGVSKAFGGDPETILLAQAGQSVARFEIENLPASVRIQETVSFTVKAVDASGGTVSGYTGTVIFSSTDTNADYPDSFTFQASNQGRKTFDLGLSFQTAGTQKIQVQEQGNALVKGEKSVEVTTTGGSVGGLVKITKPATGTYSVNTLAVEGEASPNARVKIFDNGQQVAEVQANSSGRFTYNTALLLDGQHTFHAESNAVTSVPVTVNIDSTPARVEQVELAKTNLGPGETTSILIRSDPDLNSIQATLGDTIVDLEADTQNPGLYRGILTAPASDGDYTVNVIITDKVGNISPATEVGKIHVDASLTPDSPVSFDVPSKVQGVSATPGNGRVTLTWQAAQASSGIAFYRIYYGTDLARPNVVNTQDSKTTWYIPNLQNGTKYNFQVVGIDTQGNEGDNRSDAVSAVPSEAAGGGSSGGGGTPVLCDPMPCPPDIPVAPYTPEDGPEIFGVIIAALLGGSAVRRFKRKK